MYSLYISLSRTRAHSCPSARVFSSQQPAISVMDADLLTLLTSSQILFNFLGHYKPYFWSDWHVSDDGAWEEILKGLFGDCEAWARQPHNLDGKNGMKKLAIPAGARCSARIAAGGVVPTPPQQFHGNVVLLQARSNEAQNCIAGSLLNCIAELTQGKPDAEGLVEEMQQALYSTEHQRLVNLKSCGHFVEQHSRGLCRVRKAKMLLKGTSLDYDDLKRDDFFQSDDDATFGCFVVWTIDRNGGNDHAIALIRRDKANNANNYVIDSNPMYGAHVHAFTAPALLAIDVQSIRFAVKVESLVELNRSK